MKTRYGTRPPTSSGEISGLGLQPIECRDCVGSVGAEPNMGHAATVAAAAGMLNPSSSVDHGMQDMVDVVAIRDAGEYLKTIPPSGGGGAPIGGGGGGPAPRVTLPVPVEATAAKGEAAFFRGAKAGETPSFVPLPKDFKVDPKTGFVKDTHGVSVFNNPSSVSSKGFVPHRVDQSSVPDSLRIIQRGRDLSHFEIVPMPGANLTPQQFINACISIVCVR